MNKFNANLQLLETGCENTSPQLRWLLRNVIIDHCGLKNLDLIAYHENIPTDNFGEAVPLVKAIAFNLEKHFYAAFDAVQMEDNLCMSLRALLIRELLDTAIHEAEHLKAAAKAGNFEDKHINEDDAYAAGKELAWKVAKKWDVEIFDFGGILNDLLEQIIETLREDDAEKPVKWRTMQLHMWDTKTGYYDPAQDFELGMRKTFEGQAHDDVPWIKEVATFKGEMDLNKPEEVAPAATPVENIVAQPFVPAPATPVVSTIAPIAAPIATPVASTTPAPQMMYEDDDRIVVNYDQQISETTPQPIIDTGMIQTPGQAFTQSTPAMTPAAVATTSFEIPEGLGIVRALEPNEKIDVTVEELTQCTDEVLRMLFWHTMTKCGFNTNGGYNTPNAVLDPVDISRIPNATKIFVGMNCLNAQGGYLKNTPIVDGIVRGLCADKNNTLPAYQLYFKFGNFLYLRYFIVQNPNKTKYGTPTLTDWAREAREGYRRMLYSIPRKKGEAPKEGEKGSVKVFIKLAPGLPLGQEEIVHFT